MPELLTQLRPEARPAPWEDLDNTQQEAFKSLVVMIGAAVEALGAARSNAKGADNEPPDWFRDDRASRTAFLSGSRGAGKTTVLASVIRAAVLKPNGDANDSLPRSVSDALGLLRQRVVWLEPLDMEPLPASANLLSAILVRVEDSVRRLGGGGIDASDDEDRMTYRGLVQPGGGVHDVLLDLQRLQTHGALAWEGNLQSRKGNLDPDSYAVEVARTERARLSISYKVQDVLDRLARKTQWMYGIYDPLFVLPVDDLDLNPLAFLDTLKLLRLLSVPRLFSLLIGDVTVADLLLNLKLSSELAQLVAHLRDTNLLAVDTKSIGALAGEIASNAFRKLLPPSQRVNLQSMTLQEGLNFRPLTSGRNVSGREVAPKERRLHQLLSSVEICLEHQLWPTPSPNDAATSPSDDRTPPVFVTLRDFLLIGWPPQKEGSKNPEDTQKPTPLFQMARNNNPDSEEGNENTESKQKPTSRNNNIDSDEVELDDSDLIDCTYEGRRALEATPRRLADIWLMLREIDYARSQDQTANKSANKSNHEKRKPVQVRWELARKIVGRIGESCRALLLGEPYFSPTDRKSILENIGRGPDGNWELRALPLRVGWNTDRGPLLEISTQPGARSSCRWRLCWSRGWRMYVESVFEETNKRPGGGLGTPPPGFGVQSSATERALRIVSPSTTANVILFHDLLALAPGSAGLRQNPFVNDHTFPAPWASTEWQSGGRQVNLYWPAPPLRSFWEVDLFLRAWEKSVVTRTDNKYEELKSAFYGWVNMGTQSMLRDWRTASHSSPDVESLTSLGNRATQIANTDAEDVREWAKTIALLVSPEMGLPFDIVQPLTTIPSLTAFWSSAADEITSKRVTRLAELLLADMPELVDQLLLTPSVVGGPLPPSKERVYQWAHYPLPATSGTVAVAAPVNASMNPPASRSASVEVSRARKPK